MTMPPYLYLRSNEPGKIPIAGQMLVGELAVNLADNKLFLRNNLSVVELTDLNNLSGILPVSKGGTGSITSNFVDLTSAQSISGIKTFTVSPIVPAATTSNQALQLGQVTAALVGNLTAQWNANRLQGIPVDITGLADGNTVRFNSALNRFEPVSISVLAGQAGGINTAANIGTAGSNVFKAKVGDSLQFRKLNPASSKLTIIEDTANDKIDIDVNESAFNLNNSNSILGIAKGGTGSSVKTYIDLTTDQSVAGIKTFTASPVIPAATTSNQAARLDQITPSRVGNTTAQWNANQLQGRSVSSTAPITNDVLLYNGTNWLGVALSNLKTTEAELNLSNLSGILSIEKGGTGSTTKSYIDLTTNQTVLGIKTFSSSPVVPNATSNNQAAALGQITAPQVGNTLAQWNANKLLGRDLNTAIPNIGQGMVWNGSSWAPNNVLSNLVDATSSIKGGIVLAGVLTGTASAPQLTNTGVASGTYTNADITINAQGRITAASSGSATGGGSGFGFTKPIDDTTRAANLYVLYNAATDKIEFGYAKLNLLDDIDQVSISEVSQRNNDVLAYDEFLGKYTNKTFSDLGIDPNLPIFNALYIQGIPASSTAPEGGQVQQFNAVTNQIDWTTIAGLNDLSSVNNIGIDGVGLFKRVADTVIELKKIRSTSSAITITDNISNNTVDISLDPALIGGSGGETYTDGYGISISGGTISATQSTVILSNIAALKALDPNQVQISVVKGSSTARDGGGGVFYWENTSTEIANDGTIIQSNTTSTGRWYRL